jgi:hypothetical protein
MIVTSQCQEHFDAVKKWADENGLAEKFQQTLDYLDNYANRPGCDYDKTQGKNTRCTLYQDHAPRSFGFSMERQNGPGQPWQRWFAGGVVYHGPDVTSGDTLTIDLSGDPSAHWGVHT